VALACPDDGLAEREELAHELGVLPEGLDQVPAGPPQLSHAVRSCEDGLVRPHERIQLLFVLGALAPRSSPLAHTGRAVVLRRLADVARAVELAPHCDHGAPAAYRSVPRASSHVAGPRNRFGSIFDLD